MRNRIFVFLKCFPTELLIIYKGEQLNNYTVKKLDNTLAG